MSKKSAEYISTLVATETETYLTQEDGSQVIARKGVFSTMCPLLKREIDECCYLLPGLNGSGYCADYVGSIKTGTADWTVFCKCN